MLEDAEQIDIITQANDGKLILVITDAGITTDPDDRFAKLIEKLKTYVGYLTGQSFKAECELWGRTLGTLVLTVHNYSGRRAIDIYQ